MKNIDVWSFKSQKTNFVDSVKRRDDELSTLKTQIEHLNTQIRIKNDMTAHYDDELSGLRASLDAERSRATREANALKNKTAERKLCAIQKQKLEKYAAITGASAGNEVFIHKDKSLSADADYKPHLKAIS